MLKFVILLNKWDVNKVYWARKASRANQMAYVTFRPQFEWSCFIFTPEFLFHLESCRTRGDTGSSVGSW